MADIVNNTTVVAARLTDDEARQLVELARPGEKAATVLRRLVREAHERTLLARELRDR